MISPVNVDFDAPEHTDGRHGGQLLSYGSIIANLLSYVNSEFAIIGS